MFVESSIWTGIRTHARNTEGDSSPVLRGPCQFETGKLERHEIRIDVGGTGRVNAYVDGELVQADLFARLRKRIYAMVAVLILVLSGLALLFGAWLFKN